MGAKVGDRVAYSILQSYSEYSAVPAGKLQVSTSSSSCLVSLFDHCVLFHCVLHGFVSLLARARFVFPCRVLSWTCSANRFLGLMSLLDRFALFSFSLASSVLNLS